jgi:cytoskeletal protein CcmA (bactofilin family)
MFIKNKADALVFVLTVLLVLIIFGRSSATQFRSVDNFFFPDTAIIRDDLFIGGGNIKLDGIVEGDVISGSGSLVQNGLILGSLNSVSQDLDVLGEVKGSVRGFAQNITINGTLERNLIALAYKVDIKPAAEIAKDVSVFCGSMIFDGKLEGDLKGSIGELVISGVVNGDVLVKADRITLMPTARIGGDFRYESTREAKIQPGAQVSGETLRKETKKDKEKKPKSIFTGKPLIPEMLFLLALMVTGIVLTLLCKKNAYHAKQAVGDSFLKSLAWGFVFIICIPIAVLLLIVTVIGIPVAIIVFFAYGVLIYIAKIPVATFVGEKIIKALGKQSEPPLIWSMLLGLVILALILNIPYLHWPVYFVVLFTGFGAMLNSQRHSGS